MNINNNNNNNDNVHIERRNSRFQSPHCAANYRQHIGSSGQGAIVRKSGATHLALIMFNMLYATWYKGTAQPLSLTEYKSHLFLIRWGDAWCNSQHVCFPSLPQKLECRFESQLGLEFSGCSMWHFLKLRGFFGFSGFLPSLINLSLQPIK